MEAPAESTELLAAVSAFSTSNAGGGPRSILGVAGTSSIESKAKCRELGGGGRVEMSGEDGKAGNDSVLFGSRKKVEARSVRSGEKNNVAVDSGMPRFGVRASQS